MSKAPLYVSGTIFAIIALVHLFRLYSHFNVIIGTTDIPASVSLIAAIVSGALSFWMFSSACPKCCK